MPGPWPRPVTWERALQDTGFPQCCDHRADKRSLPQPPGWFAGIIALVAFVSPSHLTTGTPSSRGEGTCVHVGACHLSCLRGGAGVGKLSSTNVSSHQSDGSKMGLRGLSPRGAAWGRGPHSPPAHLGQLYPLSGLRPVPSRGVTR